MRYGQMHRNMFLNAPQVLCPTMQSKMRGDLLFAGQVTGTEGYVGSVASGLVAGVNASLIALGKAPVEFPVETMIGALARYVALSSPKDFQPMKANFGLLPDLGRKVRGKRRRAQAHAERALAELDNFQGEQNP